MIQIPEMYSNIYANLHKRLLIMRLAVILFTVFTASVHGDGTPVSGSEQYVTFYHARCSVCAFAPP